MNNEYTAVTDTDVTVPAMAKQGRGESLAPQKPYSELQDSLSASCLLLRIWRAAGSVEAAMAFLACFRASSSCSRMRGSSPFSCRMK